MRYIEIDGETYDVPRCYECPCYDGGDGGWAENCKHPKGDGESALDGGGWWDYDPYGPHCPLRKREARS